MLHSKESGIESRGTICIDMRENHYQLNLQDQNDPAQLQGRQEVEEL